MTNAAGLARTYFGMGVAIGDYDNDGDPDMYVTAVGGGHLYRNDGGKFTEVTREANAQAGDGWLTSAAFFDMENDGDLDLFVCCYVAWTPEVDRGQDFQLTGTGHGRAYGPPTAFKGGLCTLLRNDGGKFTDVSKESGIQVRSAELKDPLGKALGVAPYDADNDGLVDLAVANDTVQNFLFHNLGNGKFEEVAMQCGTAFDQSGSPRGGMGVDWAEFKNDGSLGLAVGNFANEMIALYVCDDPKGLQFSDLANLYGLGAPTQPPLKFGLFFFDYDLDGRLDLLSANGHLENDIARVQASQTYEQSAQLFWNTGRPGRALFAMVGSESAGPDLFRPIVGRGSAYADIDGDGDLDVVLTVNGGPARLFRNDGGNANHWVRLVLAGTKSNRSAIGAKVAVEAGGRTYRRQLFPAKSYLSSVELPLTFGLGKETKADRLTILWPSGEKTEQKDIKVDTQYRIVEGAKAR
ncbi:MAG: CRTAC1 family protein [Isosphaeraceae bacterium]|nr:CRTAC1 family protein [Isosphaeraceae bacterium]